MIIDLYRKDGSTDETSEESNAGAQDGRGTREVIIVTHGSVASSVSTSNGSVTNGNIVCGGGVAVVGLVSVCEDSGSEEGQEAGEVEDSEHELCGGRHLEGSV